MKALVTGGAGFIGSHLVDTLVARGDDVTVLDNLEPQVHHQRPAYLNDDAEYIFRDICSDGTLAECIAGRDVVFHLASMVGVAQSMYQIERYVCTNVGGTARLLQSLVDQPDRIRKLVVASSMSIYGEGPARCSQHGEVSPKLRPDSQMKAGDWSVHCPHCDRKTEPRAVEEAVRLAPNSVYAVSKRDQEELCLATGRAYRIPTVALRFFNVYGPRQSLDNPYTGLAAIFQSRIKNNSPPVVFEDGLQSRDFVSVHDIVQALLLSADHDGADYEAINVGSGTPTTVLDVARVLINLYESNVQPLVEHKFRAGDVRQCYADISKIHHLLGYSPRVTFENGMRELVQWGKGVPARDGFEEAYAQLKSHRLMEE
jgi:dTDP-L-rhamnose 4-epimerase